MNDVLSQTLIDAYGIGPLLLKTPLSSSPLNYYQILDNVFKSVGVANDPIMNYLHGIYNTMIYWKFGKLQDSNIIPDEKDEDKQNRNAHEVQLSAASYILENTLHVPISTPRSIDRSGSAAEYAAGFGGTTKKRKNLKKKKKSTKANKKRKNNKKSKRKSKLMKKTIKVKN